MLGVASKSLGRRHLFDVMLHGIIEYEGGTCSAYDIKTLNWLIRKNTVLVYGDTTDYDFKARKLRTMLEQCNVGEAMKLLQSIFSEIPYHINGCKKGFYQAVMHGICSAAGINVCSEYAIAQGPVDMVLRFPQLVYIIEINYNKPAGAALHRIEKGRYYEAFTLRKVPIILLGISFIRARRKFEIAYASKRWFEEKRV